MLSDKELRSRLIRLAAAKPELQGDLLPLLQQDADPASHDQNKPEAYYGFPVKTANSSPMDIGPVLIEIVGEAIGKKYRVPWYTRELYEEIGDAIKHKLERDLAFRQLLLKEMSEIIDHYVAWSK